MKANELRVNNWYNSVKFGVPVQCELADLYELCVLSDGAYNDPPIELMFEPIPLTEEWLLKFGLIKKYLEDELEPDGYYLDDDGNRWYSWVDGGVFTLEIQPDGEIWFELYSHYQHIQYVHQIQNLYFALTGEELIIMS